MKTKNGTKLNTGVPVESGQCCFCGVDLIETNRVAMVLFTDSPKGGSVCKDCAPKKFSYQNGTWCIDCGLCILHNEDQPSCPKCGKLNPNWTGGENVH